MNLVRVFLVIFFGVLLGCKKNPTSTKEKTSQISQTISTSSAIEIIPVQHASAIIKTSATTIFIDPTGGAKPYTNHTADLVLITDIHGDHMNIDTLDQLKLENATLVVPQAVAEQLPAEYTGKISILNNGQTKNIDGITIEAIPMYNLREEALKFHTKGRGNGYIITLAGERIYFSGDTEDIPEMRALKDIDKAFVCMNLPYTMTVESAADAVLEFAPKTVYPYHYRGTNGLSDTQKFKELISSKKPDIAIVQLDWYPSKED